MWPINYIHSRHATLFSTIQSHTHAYIQGQTYVFYLYGTQHLDHPLASEFAGEAKRKAAEDNRKWRLGPVWTCVACNLANIC